MQYVRFLHNSTPAQGILTGNQVILSGFAFDDEDKYSNELLELDGLRLLAQVLPSEIVAVSTNYTEVLELLGKPAPIDPIIFDGKVNLQTTTAKMIFGVAEQIAFISGYMPLMPGDFILSEVYGVGEVNNCYVVEIEVENPGRMCNRVLIEDN